MSIGKLALLFAGSTVLGGTLVAAQSTSDLLSMQEKVVAAACSSAGDAQTCEMARKNLEMIRQMQATDAADQDTTPVQSVLQSRSVATQAATPVTRRQTGGVCTAINPVTHQECVTPGEVTSSSSGNLTFYAIKFTNSCDISASVQALASTGVPNDWRSNGIGPNSTSEITCIAGPGRKGSCSGFGKYQVHYSSCN